MAIFPTIHSDRIAPGSFQQPVPLPAALPGEPPLVTVCFNADWLPYILGAFLQLTLTSTWQAATQADLNKALQRANDLIEIFQLALPGCQTQNPAFAGAGDEFMLRQDPTNPCLLQTSVDGVTWCTWADISKCAPSPIQPGSGSPQPAPGTCQTFHATLSATDQWLLPVPVSTGDVITVTNAKGAWNDGTLADGWQCPDGEQFFAGACIGLGKTVSSDPAPTVNHMALLAHLNALYFGILAGPVTVPSGVTFGSVTFQANDTILNDNNGSIEFDVQVCNNQVSTTWTHTFDFSTGPQGWTSAPNVDGGTWSAGAWRGVNVGPSWECRIYIPCTNPERITGWQAFVTCDNCVANEAMTFDRYAACPPSGSATTLATSTNADGASVVHTTPQTGTMSPAAGACCIQADPVGHPAATVLDIYKIVFTGNGTDPF